MVNKVLGPARRVRAGRGKGSIRAPCAPSRPPRGARAAACSIDRLLDRNVGGLLIILPTDVSSVDPEDVAVWQQLEAQLMQQKLAIVSRS